MTITVLLPTTVPMPDTTPDGTRYEAYDPYQPLPEEQLDAEVLVGLGQPGPDAGRRRPPAAPAAARAADVRGQRQRGAGRVRTRTCLIASGRGLHDRPVAEHALALTLAAARRLHRAFRAQLDHEWATEIGGLQPEPSPGRVLHPARRPGDDLGLRQHRPDPGAAPHRARRHGDRGRAAAPDRRATSRWWTRPGSPTSWPAPMC